MKNIFKKRNKGLAPLHTELIPRRYYRLTFAFAIFVVAILFNMLSKTITIGPNWTVLAIACVLFIPVVIAIFYGYDIWTRKFELIFILAITFVLMSSMVFLVYSLFTKRIGALELFQSACLLWIANIIIFAIWYWIMDQGGPLRRFSNKPGLPDFLFPQMTTELIEYAGWKPYFIDYLFLSFTTNTSFGPTDTMILSRRGKLLLMTQSLNSLIILAVLAARAVNIV